MGAQVLYLPPYSTDLNPIETVFSKFKWTIKSPKTRTLDDLWNTCEKVSTLFQEEEYPLHQLRIPLQINATRSRKQLLTVAITLASEIIALQNRDNHLCPVMFIVTRWR